MRALASTLALIIGISLPLVALAQTSSNTNLSSLLAQLNALEQQIASVSAGQSSAATSSTTVQNPSTASAACPSLLRTLSVGSTGSDVTSLQTFLSVQGYFNGSATGYYGPVTEGSVSAWQEFKGVVSGGDPNSTGLGVVGPKTRAAIAATCSGATVPQASSASSQCLTVLPPSANCSSGWKPVSDANGCTQYFQCTLLIPNATASTQITTPPAPAQTTSCPVVQQPICSGTVTPFQTNSNGCVIAYQCVL